MLNDPRDNVQKRFGSRGFSLVELMISITISSFLLLGVSYIFLSSKQTYRLEENLARMQENGRLAIEYLSRDLRMAGSYGCATGGIAASTAVGTAAACSWPAEDTPKLICTLKGDGCGDLGLGFDNPAKSVFGHEHLSSSTWGPALPASLTGVNEGTDVIVIRYGTPTSISVDKDPTGTTAIDVNSVSGIAPGDVLIVSDCKSKTVFQACAINATGNKTISHVQAATGGCASPAYGNACETWGSNYKGGSILIAVRNYYYIKNLNGIPTLYRRTINGTDEPIVPQIENFQIKYGVAPTVDDYPDDYYTAKQVDDAGKWDRVKSVRIEVLVRSPDDNITTASQTYYFNEADATANDKRLRLVLTSTLGVRNRTIESTK